MTQRELWLRIHLVVALALELVFLSEVLPYLAMYSTAEAQVWKQFWVACAAVFVMFTIWPALRWGGLWLRIGGLLLCVLPLLLLAWVVMDHFDLYPRWLR
ncbi:MAG: hypothetical protein ABSD29_05935 [Verrucomicrobiota bacterium]|jgi:hypothetical protein